MRLSDVADIALTDNVTRRKHSSEGNDGVVLSFQKQVEHGVHGHGEPAHQQRHRTAAGARTWPAHHAAGWIRATSIDYGCGGQRPFQSAVGRPAGPSSCWIFSLKDAKSTFIVACSIPFSLMCAIIDVFQM